MKTPPRPPDEAARQAALRKYDILDSAPEQIYDDVTALAAHICDMPMAMISFVDQDRQWFKSRMGVDYWETPRNHAFCAYTIGNDGPMIVENATEDARFDENPYVTGNPDLRFYAGAPLVTPGGYAVGSLCVMDSRPGSLRSDQIEALERLSRLVVTQLELREAAQSIRTLSGLLPICAGCKDIRDDKGYWRDVEEYMGDHSGATFTHGLCPDCMKKHFPDAPEHDGPGTRSEARATGIGGIFYKSRDPEAARAWYAEWLGLKTNEYGSLFEFREGAKPLQKAYLQWSPMPDDTTYFNPSTAPFMVNFRVEGLETLVERMREGGVTIIDDIQAFEYGTFVHILDPDGNAIELWEPVDKVFTDLYDGTTSM
ncbi:MAG: GAF domain-containing protein [Rhodothermales bacterium]